MQRVSFIFLILVPIGCGSHAPPPAAFQRSPHALSPLQARTLDVDGVKRDYLLYVPKQCVGKVSPVIVALHGRGGKADSAIWGLGLKEAADKYGFLLISPQAIHQGVWQDGASAFDPQHDFDIPFFRKLADSIASIGGDPKRLYAMGISNGGAMAFRIGVELPDRYAAVCGVGASVAALTPDLEYRALNKPKSPISALQVHGMKDPICGYDMRTFTMSAPDAARWWARGIGASLTPEHKVLGHGEILYDRYQGKSGSEIILLSYKDAGHEWPLRFTEPTGLDINDFMWRFFERHKLR